MRTVVVNTSGTAATALPIVNDTVLVGFAATTGSAVISEDPSLTYASFSAPAGSGVQAFLAVPCINAVPILNLKFPIPGDSTLFVANNQLGKVGHVLLFEDV